MKIDFEGRVWEFDQKRISLQQGMAIQLHTGLSIGDWEDLLGMEGLAEGDNPPAGWLPALQCVYWLMHNQNGDVFPIIDADFEIFPFLEAFGAGMAAEVEALKAEREAKGEPDPTSPPRSLPDGPPSPTPASRKATTRTRPASQPARPGTVSPPAGT